MSSRCSSDSCVNGNCVGCKDGSLFCNDPRCYPDCPDCPKEDNNNSDWVLILIILILVGVLLIFAIITGIDYWNKSAEAAEPKNVTVHRHVTMPPVYSSPPQPLPVYSSPKSCPSTDFSDFTLNSSKSCNSASSQIEGFE